MNAQECLAKMQVEDAILPTGHDVGKLYVGEFKAEDFKPNNEVDDTDYTEPGFYWAFESNGENFSDMSIFDILQEMFGPFPTKEDAIADFEANLY